MDAVELIARYNRSDCFIYADPPYLRSTKTQGIYAHEMTIEQHINFLEALKGVQPTKKRKTYVKDFVQIIRH